ncbi:hypothetical protein H5410_063279 [Solanum commersonii]|uniref:Uncharacterized protein n=1 Tax=Solanum commersonii TaxID=4109 RepID=A0A9J5WCU2_SOLCO|nr:hypothetical protein H5410_063279 [Solanum commersonii]
MYVVKLDRKRRLEGKAYNADDDLMFIKVVFLRDGSKMTSSERFFLRFSGFLKFLKFPYATWFMQRSRGRWALSEP